jgi:uncharacterized protein YkwD
MRHFLMALGTAALLGSLFGCQSETTNQRAQGPEPTFPFTVRSTENTRRSSQPTLKGVTGSLPPINTAPKIAPPPPPGPNDPQFDTNLVRLFNELRNKKNQQPLSFNPILTRVAQEQAKLLAKGKPVDPMFGNRVTEAGYKYVTLNMNSTMVRELNAAAVFGGLAQNEFLVKPEYRDIGIGIDSDANNNYYIAILFAGEQKKQ